MLIHLLQRQFHPYSVRSHVSNGNDEFTATLCCNGARVGVVTVARDTGGRVNAGSGVTMLLDFEDAEGRANFEAHAKGLIKEELQTSSQLRKFMIGMVLHMVDAHLGDKKIHAHVREGAVVFRQHSDPLNGYRVIPACRKAEVCERLRTTIPDLAWIANEVIEPSVPKRINAAGCSVH